MTIKSSHRFTMLAAVLAVCGSAAVASENPKTNPYAGQEQRVIKALSAQETADLKAGRGMGLSKVAELNHFPGPKHALELAGPLQLTDAQVRKIRQQEAVMQQEAQRVGKEILAREAALDVLFAARRADDEAVRALLAEIGQLQGDLRFVHVKAHLATTRVLSSQQIAAYDTLRGYAGGEAPVHSHHHH